MVPSWKPVQRKPGASWFGPERIARLTVRRDAARLAPVHIGEGFKKTVYLGSVHFRADTPAGSRLVKKTVAIKTFKEPLSDGQAMAYNKIIKDLREKGCPIPKGAIYKVTAQTAPGLSGIAAAGEWVAIQQYFGQGAKTKIVDRRQEVERKMQQLKARGRPLGGHSDYSLLFHGKRLERTEAVRLMASLVDSGYVPKPDAVAPLRRAKGKAGAIPFDFDLVVDEYIKPGTKPSGAELAGHLIHSIRQLSPDMRERMRLFEICMGEVSSPEIKRFLVFLKGNLSEKGEEPTHGIDFQS